MGFSNHGPSNPQKPETRLVTAGRDTKGQRGSSTLPCTTVRSCYNPTAEDLYAHRAEFSYGRHGSPTTRALQDVLMSLEGPQCAGVGLVPSGLAAITTTLLSLRDVDDLKADLERGFAALKAGG
jgi:cysteine-S-conjugate beta-lyase